MNLAYTALSGGGSFFRGIVWVVVQLYEHPVIGIPVGILLICVLIVVVVVWISMQLEFNVGQLEQHHVVYRFNQVWGGLQITVDGVSVMKTVRLASLSLTNSYEFEVGENEIHHVRIEKRRRLLLAGLRPQVVTAYVDGVKVAEGATMRRQQ